MKKLIAFLLLLLSFGIGEAKADVQIDEGQYKGTASVVFFVGRYGRTGAIATAGANQISADSIVVWDTTSADGVSVQTSTTSGDPLAAGVTMDIIPGTSRDNTATLDRSNNNWGRIKVWGLHTGLRANTTSNVIDLADKLCTSGVAQQVSQCATTSGDQVGVALAAGSSSTVTAFIRRM